ncbi:unnamed protein product [Wickerhamomyces anomalus]
MKEGPNQPSDQRPDEQESSNNSPSNADKDAANESQSNGHDHENNNTNNNNNGQINSNINNYIENLDVANVLAVDLSNLENQQGYLDPSIAAAYRRAALEAQRARAEADSQNANEEGSEEHQEYIPGIPQLPPGSDPKKTCPFCQRTFSHAGSMGRHLDLKKGTESHPVDLITRMRADVKRRGDIEVIKQRRRLRSRKYYAREDVKERSRAKRRVRERILRAKSVAEREFLSRFNKPELEPHPTFARLVIFFLSPNQWPHDPPTLETYRLLCGFLNSKFLDGKQGEEIHKKIMEQVHDASENWLKLSDTSKQETWASELRKAAMESLKNISLFDLSSRDEWIMQQARHRALHDEHQGDTAESGNDGEGRDEEDDDDDEKTRVHKNAEDNDNNLGSENYYNQEELSAVAEAVVNNRNNNEDQP